MSWTIHPEPTAAEPLLRWRVIGDRLIIELALAGPGGADGGLAAAAVRAEKLVSAAVRAELKGRPEPEQLRRVAAQLAAARRQLAAAQGDLAALDAEVLLAKRQAAPGLASKLAELDAKAQEATARKEAAERDAAALDPVRDEARGTLQRIIRETAERARLELPPGSLLSRRGVVAQALADAAGPHLQQLLELEQIAQRLLRDNRLSERLAAGLVLAIQAEAAAPAGTP